MKSFLRLGLLALVASFSLGSCDSTNSNGSGRVTLHLTDAPGEVLAAVVTISEVRLLGDDGTALLLDDAAPRDFEGFIMAFVQAAR